MLLQQRCNSVTGIKGLGHISRCDKVIELAQYKLKMNIESEKRIS